MLPKRLGVGSELVIVFSPFPLVLPCFYCIPCKRGVERIRVGRSYDYKISDVKEWLGCLARLTLVHVGTGSILRGKRLRPVQDGDIRKAPLEKVIGCGKTKASGPDDDNWTLQPYLFHECQDKIAQRSTLFVLRYKAKQTRTLRAPPPGPTLSLENPGTE